MSRKSKELERIARRDAAKREAVTVWYPKAGDLLLTHLDKEVAAHVRRRLTPWLAAMTHFEYGHRLGVEGGNCWNVAQALARAAKDAGVTYVEGVWKRSWELQPVPHGWVSVDGHRVNLIKEFYSWQGCDDEFVYEPLAEFTYERLTELFDNNPEYADADISTMLWYESADSDINIEDAYEIVFKPAVTRMAAAEAMAGAA
jgi:hypothetical protein